MSNYSRNVNDLTPKCKQLHDAFNVKMKEKGLDYTVTCTARLENVQIALYAQGRDTLKNVNTLRYKAGLDPITEDENKKKVTWTLTSKHIVNDANPKSRAFDIALKGKDGKIHYDVKADINEDNKADYLQIGDIAKEVGLIWGGKFSSPDYCHLEEPK